MQTTRFSEFQLVDFLEISRIGRMDAEYWIHSVVSEQTTKMSLLRELCVFIRTGPMGSALLTSAYQKTGIPVVRPSNLNQLNCDDSNLVYVSNELVRDRKFYVYEEEDILLSRVGDMKFGMVTGFATPVTISSNLVGLQVNKKLLDPYFLLAFLQTTLAKEQFITSSKGVSLQTIGIQEIGNLRVPLLSMDQQQIIGNLLRQSLLAKQVSLCLFQEVQTLFSQVIPMDTASPSHFYQLIQLHQARASNRLDAEYYSSKATRNIGMPLLEIADFQRGVEVGSSSYQKFGTYFWRVGNISNFGFLPKSQKYIASDLYEKLKKRFQPELGDILLVKDGKPGICLVMGTFLPGILSEGIVRIRVQTYDPYYIVACIHSEFCQQQIRKHMDGSLVPHWKMEQIKKLQIPILSEIIQNKIITLMKLAYENQREMEILRNKAKESIERILLN